jgi:hypothetical protein
MMSSVKRAIRFCIISPLDQFSAVKKLRRLEKLYVSRPMIMTHSRQQLQSSDAGIR